MDALKKASANAQKSNKQRSNKNKDAAEMPTIKNQDETDEDKEPAESLSGERGKINTAPAKQPDFKQAAESIQVALSWYVDELNKLVIAASAKEYCIRADVVEKREQCMGETSETTAITPTKKPKHVLTSEQVVAALSVCDSEDALADVEAGIDIFQWGMSEWTIDITEQGEVGNTFAPTLNHFATSDFCIRSAQVVQQTQKERPNSMRARNITFNSPINWEVALCFM